MPESIVTNNPTHRVISSPEVRFKQAFEQVGSQLQDVEQRIREQAGMFDTGIEQYVDYVCSKGGKRLRPALALLSGGATGPLHSHHTDLAVIVELIHVASLVHDDIMDEAHIRREQPTANAKWGNALSVLLGDVLFSHSLRLATDFDDIEMCRRISNAAVNVCSGEVLQTRHRFDLKLGFRDYYKIIEMKTAALFAAACELGAYLSGADKETTQALKTYGLKLGTAYQIYDDCVDLIGDEDVAGKTLGTDLGKGKFTLPILLLLENANSKDFEKISNLLLHKGKFDVVSMRKFILDAGTLETSIEQTESLLAEAREALSCFSEDPYSDGLMAIVDYVDSLVVSLK
ncbi:MAG: polyprenyl synthetase family protein [Chthoniobacterales bacterium]